MLTCKNRNPIVLGCLLVGASLAPLAAHANPIVSMELTGVAGPSLGGNDTDPYFAQIGPQGLTQGAQFTAGNSSAAVVYCDDFYDDVSIGHVWQATVTNMSALSGTAPLTNLMFDTTNAASQEQSYMAAAWLAEQIAAQNQSLSSGQQTAEQDSYALWYIFDPSALAGLSTTDGNAALNDYNTALAAVANDTPQDFANVNIYTPLEHTPGSADSQEYLAVDAPEPGTLALMTVGLAGLGWMARRRRQAKSSV
ncbi:MAG TPA: PEP-CTERM sorting domain-containing protein [Steroidobacteraceae bacterium]|nr:PEP-CTERM sorting domain-containing protein [Steroidobacteraceae bacterium]